MLLWMFTLGLTLMISGMLGYATPLYAIVLLASGTYVVERFMFKTKQVFAVSFTLMMASIAFAAYLMHRQERLGGIVDSVKDFLSVYVISVVEPTITISGLHETVIIVLIAFLISMVLHGLFYTKNIHFGYLVGFIVGFSVIGFLSYSLDSKLAGYGFYLVALASIGNYFYHFYKTRISYTKPFMPIVTTVVIFAVIIVQFAQFGYSINPSPFVKTGKGAGGGVNSGPVHMGGREGIDQFIRETFEIQPTFEHNNIPVLRIKHEFLSYLKADTFEIYSNGIWLKDSQAVSGALANITDSIYIDPLSFKDYYVLEEVGIKLDAIKTNVLFSSAYGNHSTNFSGDLAIRYDRIRNTYFTDEKLPEAYEYTFDAISPRYGYATFRDFVNRYANRQIPIEVITANSSLPEELDRIRSLAEQITKDVDGKYNKALAIEAYLRANYTYNDLPPAVTEDTDPILFFLFESKEGFCQQFSSAMILMLRSIDIPARYATGYYIEPVNMDDFDMPPSLGEEFTDDGYQTVYDSNAHTWVEAYFPEVGWLLLEPTPGRNYTYTDNSVDAKTQEEIEEELALLDEQESSPEFVWKSEYTNAILIMAFLSVVGAVLYVLYRHKYHLRKMTVNEKIICYFKIIQMYYAHFEFQRKDSETPREYAHRVDNGLLPIHEYTLEKLVRVYERIIYGEMDGTEEELTHFIGYLSGAKYFLKFQIGKMRFTSLTIIEFFMV
ncbi:MULTISPECIES: transglutaminase domain-containing protein [unclassified Fusibacter]|uniref:DUF4129 domain-containing transglutaminase family protein n=1 Tax=unclassified Fusibacter TaxID=2624464 RepID=UPI0010115735|nr:MULTISPECIES: transglutaminase domain-containing protein [unclassified Fusibacter]MCK8060948.1 transglutaminase domain-containing protein [Fusibacter sp. A2]NPE23244.1 transglutaminase domain-containing protein [Fusibacter sp. A1]RXV59598.1 DUF4129 domain-containing protein [Fusibacter sp. A1]